MFKVLLAMVAILPLSMVAADSHTVEVFVHGERMEASPEARVDDGEAYAPLRAISEAVGAEVTWLENRQTAVVCRNDQCVDIPREQAVEVEGHLLVPVRQLSEAIQMEVDWHPETRQIGIRDTDSAVGMKAIPLSLRGVDGPYERDSYDDAPATVIVFWANHCPTVIAYEDRFIDLVDDYAPRDVEFVAVASNSPERYPADNFENMKIRAKDRGYNFPYVHDTTQEVARYFKAERTPDAYVINPEGFVVYRGRIESSQDPEKVTRHDLREALDEILAGESISVRETPPHGCTIKWKE